MAIVIRIKGDAGSPFTKAPKAYSRSFDYNHEPRLFIKLHHIGGFHNQTCFQPSEILTLGNVIV